LHELHEIMNNAYLSLPRYDPRFRGCRSGSQM
jgi:hypothetical protein